MTPLEQWLAKATSGLSAESAALVRSEIEQHCDDAHEAGADPIAALGSPRTANRAYRKVLLTEWEARMAVIRPKCDGKCPISLALAQVAFIIGCWLVFAKGRGPAFWLVLIGIFSGSLLGKLFPPDAIRTRRIFTRVAFARLVAFTAIGWHYDGWFHLITAALILGHDWFTYYQWVPVFRKLAAGQTTAPLPEKRGFSTVEAVTLRRLEEGDPSEKAVTPFVFLILGGMTLWLPAAFLPPTMWMVANYIAQRTLPIYTEQRSRWFRAAKWGAMATAAALPVLHGARIPWLGAIVLAFLFVLFDLTNISLRRKLPAVEWPKRLYW